MGKFYDEIPQGLCEWIKKQHMFWVATAPLSAQGHINVSPKGTADCFHVVNSKQVWYEDLSGTGVETISHIRENGRITVMFCAFEGPPRILRLFGVGMMYLEVFSAIPFKRHAGTVHEYGSSEYNRRVLATSRKPGSRAAIVIDVYQVGTSCGYAVPMYDFVMHRTQLHRLAHRIENGDRALAAAAACTALNRLKSSLSPESVDDGAGGPYRSLRAYWLAKNMTSLDGLPGLLTAPDATLGMTPQSRFDEHGPRPRLHRDAPRNSGTFRDCKWFVAGFVVGAATVLAIGGFVGGSKM